MTVVLAGVGADTTNVGTLAPLYDDGRFEYVPIPEKTRETTETATVGSWALRYDDRTAADLTTRIDPQPIGDGESAVTGAALESWPLHRDPNFAALTYGEHRERYVSRLRTLEDGDVVGFYAGLRRPDGGRAHRYLIGYFTVGTVDVITPETPREECERILEAHAGNAHAKRARGGTLYREEKTVALVAGREPGGLFERDPIRISDYYVKAGNERAQYYLREEVREAWRIVEGGDNMTFKPAYRCDLSGPAFVDRVGRPGTRAGLESGSDGCG